ncbi:MAG: aminotransferase class I/II-fold pyridoxal phosphate-dependent enzyme [Intrasporangium sp.]|uniref:aminotransferase class I/II-fold pyridoxal phosphate-dependent enzyme n=1 Tax=Intrasporangium sp. TaxID=1925024 RepID=UPI003F7E782E
MREVISEIETRLDEPTARGLATAVSRSIHEGALQGGDRLPPIRTLAHHLGLSPTTVSAAWALLARAGSIHTAGRRGTLVADSRAPRDGRYRRTLERPLPFALDLSTGVPDAALLPSLSRALASLTTPGTPHSYLDDPVLPELRAVLVDDWPYPPPEMTVVDGAMDALELVIRTTLRFGDRVVVEHPSFPPLLDLLEHAGVEVVGVPLDRQGLVPDRLAEALTKPTAAVFLQPRAHNPTGTSMSAARARSLARILRPADALVIEDDSASGISTSPDVSIGTWLPERTVHIRSFSKSHGPDLRLAALSASSDLVGAIHHQRQLGQGWSSRLLQRLLLGLLIDPRSAREITLARAEYARRRNGFVDGLQRQGIPVAGDDGLNVWVPVDDEPSALMRLAAQGVGVAPGTPFQVLPETAGHVRVTTGLITRNLDEVAREVAAAAHATGWGSRAR